MLKALAIFDCFKNDDQELSIKEIASKMDVPQSSIYRVIQSLEFVGFIFQNRENKKYRVGPKLISLFMKYNCINDYKQIAAKFMDVTKLQNVHRCQIKDEVVCKAERHKIFFETVNLAIASCDKIMLIHRVESHHVLHPNFELNVPFASYKTGLGKIFLADMTTPSLQWIYQNNTKDIGTSFDEFLTMSKKVKKDGYAEDDQVFCPGLRCVAAPIKGSGGKVLFSVSVSAPVIRMEKETFIRSRELLMKYTRIASEEIADLK